MLLSVLVFGFLVGVRHALEADHVAAVASLAANSRSLGETIRLGSVWGVGHTLTLFGFGALALSMDALIPEQLSRTLEALVGLMLVILGADLIRRRVRDQSFPHHHAADGPPFRHIHRPSAPGHRHGRRTFPGRALLVGMIHGMAGSAALIVLALQTVSSVSLGLLYITVFGAGSIVGMSLCAAAISVPLRWAGRRTQIYRGLQAVIAVATVALGMMILWEQGGGYWTIG
ncbi:MAG: hypothetical protein MUF20_04760 [Methylotetracoccus sp.]|jgi:ABC-type nickel/cobalt efflux system permease component RcnA|nr:hypothetical protein [Methylotetracoccus sp.]